jgi:DNA-binding IclR family transcriptional regulator
MANTNNGVPSGDTETVKSIQKMFAIVEALKELDGGRVYEVADYTDFSDSTVYKHLNTLLTEGFVVKDGKTYQLSLQFLTLGGYTRTRLTGSERIWEKVQELSDRTGEMTHFTTEEHGRPVILYVFRGDSGVHTRATVGQRLYMHQVASGKAILSIMSDEEIETIIDRHGLPQATDQTITDRDRLFEEIEVIQEQGVAFNREESAEGVTAAAVPVVIDDGRVLGAVTVSGPSYRLKGDRLTEELTNELHETVNELELNLRYSPD